LAVRVPEQAAVREHELAREGSEAALRRAYAATAVSPGYAYQAQEEAHRAADDVTMQVQPITEDDARERPAGEERLAEDQCRREIAAVQPWKTGRTASGRTPTWPD
jgi:hypothetical protein